MYTYDVNQQLRARASSLVWAAGHEWLQLNYMCEVVMPPSMTHLIVT